MYPTADVRRTLATFILATLLDCRLLRSFGSISAERRKAEWGDYRQCGIQARAAVQHGSPAPHVPDDVLSLARRRSRGLDHAVADHALDLHFQ